MKGKILYIVVCSGLIFCSVNATAQKQNALPTEIQPYVRLVEFGNLENCKPDLTYAVLSKNIIRVSAIWNLKDSVKQNDLQINILPAFKPTFNWAPQLTPSDEHIIAQHVFRTPALIVASSKKELTIIPDIDMLKKGSPVDWYMDMDASANKLTIGMSESKVKEHVLFVRKPGAVFPPGKIELGFYILITNDPVDLFDPFKKVLSFFWKKWGEPLYKSGEPLHDKDLEPYIKQTYEWAFDSWKKSVWQEFNLNGKDVGAPVFIVNVTQSPDYQGQPDEREFRSIWNQAWFSSLRSAEGLYRYARIKKDSAYKNYALKTKELALSFPQKKGFFYSVIATKMKTVEINGKKYNRSEGWDTYYFGNSNRNPYSNDPEKSPFHILDMSYTAYLMLTWYDELEKDNRLLTYATKYADALIKIQNKDGFFPGWISVDSLKPLGYLNESPESSMSVTFLLKLYQITKKKKYLESALLCMNSVIKKIISVSQWEDFETYWSCSRYGSLDLVGKKVERNNMFKQNTLSMYYTAQALYNCYEITHQENYLKYGLRTLNEMLMYQASWQPPYMYVNVLGGFGVMNGDAEWNDSRESLFAGLIVKYGKLTGNRDFVQRGLAALRASFVMMYTPLNPRTKKQWEAKWKFFGPKDYGFIMENYGHGGETNPEGLGIGEFTIFDWGNGAAAEAYNRMVDHFGKSFILKN
jgi:hypothetical protein